jgi:hypothetical protein
MLMYFPKDVLPRSSHADISESLTNQNFLVRLVFGVDAEPPSALSASSTPIPLRSIYVVFVKQIPWDPHAARRFRACIHLMNTLPEIVHDPRKHAWLLEHPAIHLKKPRDAPPQPSGNAADNSAATTTDYSRPNSCSINSTTKKKAAHVSIGKTPCIPACRAMCAQHQQHAAADYADVTCYFHLVVDKDFVEKQEIALWSVPQMQRAARSNGVLTTRNGNVERCRSSFTRQITALIAEMSFYEPSILDERV